MPRSETTSTHNQSVETTAQRTEKDAAPRGVAEPQLPHEHDESSHSQASAEASQQVIGKQAFEDTVGPAQDTDVGPVLDEVYNRTLDPDRTKAQPPR